MLPSDSALPEEQPIEVRFSVSKSLWFDMIFVAGTQGRIVEAADATWSIVELFDWLEGIVRGEPLAVMVVEREGFVDTVAVRHVDERRCHLRISDWVYEGVEEDIGLSIYVDAVVSRRKLVWEVYYELMRHSEAIGIHRDAIPGLGRVPVVEEWLDWERSKNSICLIDDVTGIERAE